MNQIGRFVRVFILHLGYLMLVPYIKWLQNHGLNVGSDLNYLHLRLINTTEENVRLVRIIILENEKAVMQKILLN